MAAFNEQSLRQAISDKWGEAGVHIDVYDSLLKEIERLGKELISATGKPLEQLISAQQEIERLKKEVKKWKDIAEGFLNNPL